MMKFEEMLNDLNTYNAIWWYKENVTIIIIIIIIRNGAQTISFQTSFGDLIIIRRRGRNGAKTISP